MTSTLLDTACEHIETGSKESKLDWVSIACHWFFPPLQANRGCPTRAPCFINAIFFVDDIFRPISLIGLAGAASQSLQPCIEQHTHWFWYHSIQCVYCSIWPAFWTAYTLVLISFDPVCMLFNVACIEQHTHWFWYHSIHCVCCSMWPA